MLFPESVAKGSSGARLAQANLHEPKLAREKLARDITQPNLRETRERRRGDGTHPAKMQPSAGIGAVVSQE